MLRILLCRRKHVIYQIPAYLDRLGAPAMARTSWDKQSVQSNGYNDVEADLQEKEAIEQEITRRGVTNYHWAPSGTYRYVHDRCHCQCWVVTL